MEEDKQLVEIERGYLRAHPDNPRKDIGDITELTASIKAQGILQNLTVMPVEDLPGGDPYGKYYVILIGHRRFEAGKAAGVESFPCRVVRGLSHSEQIAMMLEENIQRNDLTIIEQAKGMQMLLDLGESYQSITEKTGFSESTVRHRVNLLKLDEELLEEKSHQLTLTDLTKLESIPEDRRDEALKNAYSSASLTAAVERISDDVARENREKEIRKALDKMGMEEDPHMQSWGNDIKQYKWNESTVEALKGDFEDCAGMRYKISFMADAIFVKISEEEKNDEPEESMSEKVEKANTERKRHMSAIWHAEKERLFNKLIEYAKENIDKEEADDKTIADLARKYMKMGQDEYHSEIDAFEIVLEACDIESEDEETGGQELINRLPTQAKLVLYIVTYLSKPFDWNFKHIQQIYSPIIESILDNIPFMFSEEVKELFTGKSSLYDEITEETLEQ